MITEDYVSHEVAKLLKEKGFDFCCEFQYINCSSGYPFLTDIRDDAGCYYKNSEIGQDEYSAPTIQMAMKWLREVHNLFIFISTWLRHKDGTVQYYYEIRNLNDKDFETISSCTIKEFDSYEKTCEAAIKYCLENLI